MGPFEQAGQFINEGYIIGAKNDRSDSGGTLRQKETKREKERKREKKREKRENNWPVNILGNALTVPLINTI